MMDTQPQDQVRSLQSLRDELAQRMDSLPNRLAVVARYCIDHPDAVALSKIGELASLAGVHPSTIVRFGQSLGYQGFSDFQRVFRESMLNGWPEYQTRIDTLILKGETPESLVDNMIDVSVRSLETLKATVDRAKVHKAIEELADSSKIYLLGQKRSFTVSFYLAYALRKLDVRSALIDSNGGLLMERASWCRKEDALIAISFAPYAQPAIEVAEELSRRGLKIIAITDSKFSPLVPLSSTWLEVHEDDYAAFRSLAATFALAMTLAIGVAERRGLQKGEDGG
jgi:DNA-binding MurR/RpiR family transcriptional regulator